MRGDPSAEALSYKQVSRSASEPLPLSLVIVKTHAASVSFCVKPKRSVGVDLRREKHGGA